MPTRSTNTSLSCARVVGDVTSSEYSLYAVGCHNTHQAACVGKPARLYMSRLRFAHQYIVHPIIPRSAGFNTRSESAPRKGRLLLDAYAIINRLTVSGVA